MRPESCDRCHHHGGCAYEPDGREDCFEPPRSDLALARTILIAALVGLASICAIVWGVA
jgi:hypothetical protein